MCDVIRRHASHFENVEGRRRIVSMNKKRTLPSQQIDSNESGPKSPPSKWCILTYKEKRDFLMSNKRVTIQCVVVDILESNL